MSAATPRHVLIVDDDTDLRQVISLSVQAMFPDARVRTAENGEVAMARLAEDASVTLIILDLLMPGMDGSRFARQLAADPSLSTIPVLVCSSLPRSKLESIGMPDNVRGYLRKPVTTDKLVREVKALCS
ncbi:MAG: response regulator [Polyangiales bacterium]